MGQTMETAPTAWVEVDTAAIRHNYAELRRLVGPDVAVMAVIKTNAYGHGLELVAKALAGEAAWFGVSTVEEGIRARAAAPQTSILVFQPVGPWNAALLVENNLTATVDSETGALALAEAGRAAGRVPVAHLKLDTGMSRFGIGLLDNDALARTAQAPDVQWTGMYTHLATAANGKRDWRARTALSFFAAPASAIQILRAKNILLPASGGGPWFETVGQTAEWFHALNSAGTLLFLDECTEDLPNVGSIRPWNMVRVGTLLYGQYPSKNVPRPLDLKPTWAYKTRIVSLRKVPAGRTVGYGAEWTARRESVIATIPVGYYDGLTVEPLSVWKRQSGIVRTLKRLQGQKRVNIVTSRGPAPIVGRVAAQSAMVDVTSLSGVAVGDIVEVPARRVLVGEHIPRVEV
jgi:alanine racemase